VAWHRSGVHDHTPCLRDGKYVERALNSNYVSIVLHAFLVVTRGVTLTALCRSATALCARQNMCAAHCIQPNFQIQWHGWSRQSGVRTSRGRACDVAKRVTTSVRQPPLCPECPQFIMLLRPFKLFRSLTRVTRPPTSCMLSLDFSKAARGIRTARSPSCHFIAWPAGPYQPPCYKQPRRFESAVLFYASE
jgi:hypothetical protein